MVSPFQRANAGIIWVEQPGDYANPIPTTAATGPTSVIASTIRDQVLADIEVAFDSKRYPRRSIEPNTIYKIVRDLIRMTTEQSPKEISDD